MRRCFVPRPSRRAAQGGWCSFGLRFASVKAGDRDNEGGIFSHIPVECETEFFYFPSQGFGKPFYERQIRPHPPPATTPTTGKVKESADNSIGAIVSEYRVSAVFEKFGCLWQWRSLLLPQRDGTPPTWCLLPFLLYPGRIVEPQTPVISSAAMQRISSSLQRVEADDTTTSSLREEERRRSATVVQMPSAIGLLTPHVCSFAACSEAEIESPGDPSMWATSYFDLLDLILAWEQQRSATAVQKVKPLSFQEQMKQNGWAATIRPRTTAPAEENKTIARVESALQSIPAAMHGETAKEYAARCWTCVKQACARAGPKQAPLTAAPTDQSASESSACRDFPPIPAECRNIIGGGLAELIISLDRYASLIARGEMDISAACWALLCDVSSPQIVFWLRRNALALEREVIAATAAQHDISRLALRMNRTLVGKSCSSAITLLHYPLAR